MGCADPVSKLAEAGVVMAARGSGLVLVEMDHFMRHGGHEHIGAPDQPGGNGDFAEILIARGSPVSAPEVAEAVPSAHHAKTHLVRMGQVPTAKGWTDPEILIGPFQHFGGQA